MARLLPGAKRGRPWSPERRRRGWLATWLQARRRGRQIVLRPAPVLQPRYGELLAWEWTLPDPYKWNVWMSLDAGASWLLVEDYWAYGNARQFAPDGGSELYFIVGVDEFGRALTEPSNVVRPDDAVPTLQDALAGYWDGDAALDATGSQLLLPVAAPAYGSTGGPNGGPACALGSADFVYSDDAVFFTFDALTLNAWVRHNESSGLGFLTTRSSDGSYASYTMFVALDAQVGSVGHYHSTTQGESTPYDFGSSFGVAAGDWYMLTLISTATQLHWYLNGTWRATLNKSFSTERLGDVAFRVKDNHPWGTWTGAWANLGVWSRALGAEEVAQLYNDGQGRQFFEL